MNLAPPTEWWRPAPAVKARREAPVAAAPSAAERPSGALAFRALMAFTIILVLAPQDWLPELRPWRIALLAAVVGVAAHLRDRLLKGRPLMAGGRETALTLGLAAWATVTLPLSYWPGGSASFLLDGYSKTVALFWLLSGVVDTLPRLRHVAWCLTWLTVPLALTGVKNFLSGSFIDVGPMKRIVGYESGLTKNPNDLALLLALILPLTVALLLASRGRFVQLLLLAIALLQTVAVTLTFSRGGFLTLAAVFIVYLWRTLRRGRIGWAAAALAAALVGASLLPHGYLARLGTIADIDSDPTGSAQVRWGDTLASVRFVLAHPLIGAGMRMNTLALNEIRGETWMEVHNVYLQYAVELGLPGLALFLLLFLACVRKVRDVRRRASSMPGPLSELSRLAEGIEISLLAFAVAAFFYPVGYHFYFYYFAGLAVGAHVVYAKATAQGPGGLPPVTAEAP